MNETCPTCKRPVWDGGHALNERECDEQDGEVCRLHARYAALREQVGALLALTDRLFSYNRGDEPDDVREAYNAALDALRAAVGA